MVSARRSSAQPRLAEIEQSIREEYNHKISDARLRSSCLLQNSCHGCWRVRRVALANEDDQLVRVIQHMYIGKPSRSLAEDPCTRFAGLSRFEVLQSRMQVCVSSARSAHKNLVIMISGK